MSDDELNVSSTTKIGMPLRNLLAIIGTVAAGVMGYTQLENRIGDLETRATLMASEVKANSEFSQQLQRGELSTAASQEMFLLLEHTSKQLAELEIEIADGKAVSINKQQELTLKFLGDRVITLETKIENLRDKFAEMKANGNGSH
tara:strand:- start:59 stop:496 length:438 start_codon:yes stop_codon:yes gene_type:complete